ncbi:MAG TPA: hypothetical protein VJV79_07835 [Polyangiaceae bacterium]|nr:hypothetical protein [Polyangiaceae bacterium]
MVLSSAAAVAPRALATLKTFKLCFGDDNAPHGLLDLSTAAP